ncbi:solute carrier family 51 subunit beta isoform X1 [Nerophis ophidion]|uniref:solute carrier family 51 subunit beta isoform X1 n=1 Tax=Nerophis ophidion TaxID=159077 RepID=UPI002ADFDA00|nr:solute carrier family 51 subunit beta isoform X1 [Nerophis ophidion]
MTSSAGSAPDLWKACVDSDERTRLHLQPAVRHHNMLGASVVFFLLLTGAGAFMLHNTHSSLCLEDSWPAGGAVLKKCSLDSEAQQWRWKHGGLLTCVATSRCLSSRQPDLTRPCPASEGDEDEDLAWECNGNVLVSRGTSLLLSADRGRLLLSPDDKGSVWRSLDAGHVCQETLRPRRSSHDTDESTADGRDKLVTLTDEQKEYLRWFYRTEDQTMWKFVLLGLAFVCLLVGFLLLGMGAMASRNRRKIAKYKAAAALVNKSEETWVVTHVDGDDYAGTPSPRRSNVAPCNGDASELNAGSIVVTWKDGNTSCLYADAPIGEELPEPEKEEEEEEEVKERGDQ